MKISLIQVDGKIPNLALMRIAAFHKRNGDDVELFRQVSLFSVSPIFDAVYVSAIFDKSKPLVDHALMCRPDAIAGGTGVSVERKLSDVGIPEDIQPDYELWPEFRSSLGYTQRGCRLRCSFCVVPRKEGAIKSVSTISDIWRGDPHPRELLLLDNDFFGVPEWRDRMREIREGGFRVSFTQGINVRFITDEAAEAIASVDYRDSDMKQKRIYTAWDNHKDEDRLFEGLRRLVKHGVKPWHIMVYMLIGYWPGETAKDRDYRRNKLREFGAMPYPMPYVRTKELVGFQRWVVGAYDKRFSWDEWSEAGFRPENLSTDEAFRNAGGR